jgi:hypothetical protein
MPGQPAVGHLDAALRVELADALAVPGVDLGNHRRPEFLDGGEIREVLEEMVIDKHPGSGHAQEPGKEQAVKNVRQASGPAPPLMIFFQPVGIGFFEKLHSCLAGSLAAALCRLAVF